jgi:hypothetical protein
MHINLVALKRGHKSLKVVISDHLIAYDKYLIARNLLAQQLSVTQQSRANVNVV